jgi:hypothetical protein
MPLMRHGNSYCSKGYGVVKVPYIHIDGKYTTLYEKVKGAE